VCDAFGIRNSRQGGWLARRSPALRPSAASSSTVDDSDESSDDGSAGGGARGAPRYLRIRWFTFRSYRCCRTARLMGKARRVGGKPNPPSRPPPKSMYPENRSSSENINFDPLSTVLLCLKKRYNVWVNGGQNLTPKGGTLFGRFNPVCSISSICVKKLFVCASWMSSW